METTVLITAFILIGLGVLVKRFPILIAGYNTMSKEEKMNVDVKGLSAFMCYSLVGMGTVPVLAYYICLGLGHVCQPDEGGGPGPREHRSAGLFDSCDHLRFGGKPRVRCPGLWRGGSGGGHRRHGAGDPPRLPAAAVQRSIVQSACSAV